MKNVFRNGILAAVGLYTVCTVLFFFPSFSSFSTSLIGPPEDNMLLFWSLWHGTGTFLKSGLPAIFHTDYLYYPDGVSLFYGPVWLYGVAVSVLLHPFFSTIQVYNFLVLHSFVFSGVGAFCLIRYLTGDTKVSLVGGFIFAFSPAHFVRSLHHAHLANMQFIPFFVLFTIKSMKEKNWKNPLLAALFLVLNTICDWNYFVQGAVFLIMVYFYRTVSKRKFLFHDTRQAALIMGAAVFILLPLIIPMSLMSLQHPKNMYLPGHYIFFADFFSFFIPHHAHWIGHTQWIGDYYAKIGGFEWENKIVYLGWINILLVLVASKTLIKYNAKYLGAFFAFLILAMGPLLHLGGFRTAVYLPYQFLMKFPLFLHARSPARFMTYGYLFLGVLVAFSLKRLFLSRAGSLAAKALFVGIASLIFFDFYSTGIGSTPVYLPKAYEIIMADEEKDFGILNIPAEQNYGASYLMFQTLHHVPTVEGYIGRRSQEALVDRLPFDPRMLRFQKNSLFENHVKYIVIHKELLRIQHENLAKSFLYKPTPPPAIVLAFYSKNYPKVYEDDNQAVFRVY